MGKKYVSIKDEQRELLLRLIHKRGYTIARAAKATRIYYPTAKAINKVYETENRIKKKKCGCQKHPRIVLAPRIVSTTDVSKSDNQL